MNIEEKLQMAMKELDTLKARLTEIDNLRQKTFQKAIEVQGAVKVLIELVNEQKAPPAHPVVPAAINGKKKKEPLST